MWLVFLVGQQYRSWLHRHWHISRVSWIESAFAIVCCFAFPMKRLRLSISIFVLWVKIITDFYPRIYYNVWCVCVWDVCGRLWIGIIRIRWTGHRNVCFLFVAYWIEYSFILEFVNCVVVVDTHDVKFCANAISIGNQTQQKYFC